jgi:hypothetical protein
MSKSNGCSSGAWCRAQSGAVARGEVRSSDTGDRVVKRFGNLPQRKPTEANNFGSFKAENDIATKGEMGRGWKGIEAGGDGRLSP